MELLVGGELLHLEFYNHVNDEYDYVFAITSVAKYTAIPHFEIMGA